MYGGTAVHGLTFREALRSSMNAASLRLRANLPGLLTSSTGTAVHGLTFHNSRFERSVSRAEPAERFPPDSLSWRKRLRRFRPPRLDTNEFEVSEEGSAPKLTIA
ncbi:MAG: hypothetical protein ACREPY_07645 [Rhodanobacteraceae bacterium]